MKKLNPPVLVTVLITLLLTGCVTGPRETDMQETVKNRLDAYARQLEQKETELFNREIELLQKQEEAKEQKRVSTAVTAYAEDATPQLEPIDNTVSAIPQATGGSFPANAQPGQCYAKTWVPPVYENVSEQLKVKDEETLVEIIPAEYEFVMENVLVSEASSRLIPIPAVYGTETESVQVKDAERRWLINQQEGAPEAAKELLDAAEQAGVNLDQASGGMCFHEHFRPARFENFSEQVLVKEASESVVTVPPRYEIVEKQIEIQAQEERTVRVPAVYDTVEEQVIDTPARTVWQECSQSSRKVYDPEGEIMCLVELPATYKTLSKRVLVSGATTRTEVIPAQYQTISVRELVEDAREERVSIPAEYATVSKRRMITEAAYIWHDAVSLEEPESTRTGRQICLFERPAEFRTISRQVVITPASTKSVDVPAEYRQVRKRKLVTPEREKTTVIPAEFRTVTKQKLVSDGREEWRSVLCEADITNERIALLQNTLDQLGFNPGEIDGFIGPATMSALNEYQRASGLPVDQYLNLDTLRSLGIPLP
ncbi:MAG: peptidoglycan-binding domain-containing protein [Pseudomonadota bacterium]